MQIYLPFATQMKSLGTQSFRSFPVKIQTFRLNARTCARALSSLHICNFFIFPQRCLFLVGFEKPSFEHESDILFPGQIPTTKSWVFLLSSSSKERSHGPGSTYQLTHVLSESWTSLCWTLSSVAIWVLRQGWAREPPPPLLISNAVFLFSHI